MATELVINGSFTGSGSGWTFGDSGAYGNNDAVMSNSGSHSAQSLAFMQSLPTIIDGTVYRVSFDVIQIDGVQVGSYFGIELGGGGGSYQHVPLSGTLAVGSYEYDITCSLSNGYGPGDGLIIFSYNDLTINPTFYIDNVSIKTIGGNVVSQNVFLVASDPAGDVQLINAGTNDDSTPIYYELETQELEFSDRVHLKKISDQLTVVTKDGLYSQLQAREDDGDYKNIPVDFNERTSIGDDINLEGHFFTFRWFGQANKSSPILEEIYIENVEDKGITNP